MTVIIRTGGRTGRERAATVKTLVALANGNVRHIVSTTGGVEVPDELAYDYLNQFYAVPVNVAPEPGGPVPLAEVVKANTLLGVEATPLEPVPEVMAVESIPATELVETSPEPKPKKQRKPRKPATTSDEGAE